MVEDDEAEQLEKDTKCSICDDEKSSHDGYDRDSDNQDGELVVVEDNKKEGIKSTDSEEDEEEVTDSEEEEELTDSEEEEEELTDSEEEEEEELTDSEEEAELTDSEEEGGESERNVGRNLIENVRRRRLR